MSALAIIIVPTINVKAQSYTSDDSVVIQSQYHDLFNNYFSGKESYLYFPYSCNYNNYNRSCYFGIDKSGNYLKISYTGDSYNYNTQISSGVDENFSVTGSNVVRKSVKPIYIILYGLGFIFALFIISLLLGGLL